MIEHANIALLLKTPRSLSAQSNIATIDDLSVFLLYCTGYPFPCFGPGGCAEPWETLPLSMTTRQSSLSLDRPIKPGIQKPLLAPAGLRRYHHRPNPSRKDR